ncbi:N-formylglutamate amidohydrolase [Phaeovulum sp.]|uniref:N-formylglutamate amidohydrolase n=1 Tax=Phaeovulum sp. TaxID=2934796 RepID=UPI0039E34467
MTDTFLALDEPPAYGVVNPDGASPYVLLCEHASPRIPRGLDNLGLADADRMRHIGWDIGAQALALGLSAALDAPLFVAQYSRLVVDCNRPLGNPSMMPEVSETTEVPGNRNLDEAARQARLDALFRPYHAAIARRLDARQVAGLPTLVVGVHSFTPVYKGQSRPWHAGILYDGAQAFGQSIIAELALDPALTIAANEPYRIDVDDYTVPIHGDARGLPAVLLEVRHDLIGSHSGVREWTRRLSAALRAAEGHASAGHISGQAVQ